MDIPEAAQRGSIKMEGLESPFYEKRLRELGVFSLKKNKIGVWDFPCL